MSWNDSEVLFKAVVENDLEKLKELLDGGANINATSSEEVECWLVSSCNLKRD